MSDKTELFNQVKDKSYELLDSLEIGRYSVSEFKVMLGNFSKAISYLEQVIINVLYRDYSDFFSGFVSFCENCNDEDFLIKNIDEVASSLSLIGECMDDLVFKYKNIVSVCACCGKETIYLPMSSQNNQIKAQIGNCVKMRSETFNKDRYTCLECGSVDRSRMIVTYLDKIKIKKAGEDFSLLHIAPDKSIENWLFRNCPHIKHDTTDLYMDGVSFKSDIQDLKEIEDKKYDLIICSHVLEHVQNDRLAMVAMQRVLKDDGRIIFLVPVNLDADKIDEEWGLDEIENIRRFGQKDHCRRYSKAGLIERLSEFFTVHQLGIEYFGANTFFQCGLTDTSTLYVLTKTETLSDTVENDYTIDDKLCKDGPLVTVIMSAYNHEKFVAEAIESVINQSYKNIEFLVADDCSVDNTATVMKRYSKHFTKEFYFDTNGGGRGRFLRQYATGKYIALMHSDDVWDNDKLALQVAYMESHPECGACLSWARYTDETLRVFEGNDTFIQGNCSNAEWLKHFWYKGNSLCNPSSLVRKEYYGTFIQYGGAGRQLPDLFKWIYMVQHTSIYIIPKVLIYMRRHNDGNVENTSTKTPVNTKRTNVEFFQSWFLNIRDMDDKVFVEAFNDALRDKNVTDHNEVKCEKYFFMLGHTNEIMQGYAIMYFDDIYRDTKTIFEEKYNYSRTDYWNDEAEKGFANFFN